MNASATRRNGYEGLNTKHIKIDCHFDHENIRQGLISTGYMRSEYQLENIFKGSSWS